ncbi:MAG TPA: hypothetical protein VNS32_13120 [Flavisolibacter sp.]|nr:hypothetical protein [Flavisolibacter sp.]
MHRRIVSFKQTCPLIEFAFELIHEKSSYFPQVLLIKVIGKYRDGSEGDDDAKLIKGMMVTGIDLWRPGSVLLDFTELQYEWGDYIDYVFEASDFNKPIAIVVGPKCRIAISTLIYGLDSDKDIVDNINFFDNADTAINKLLNTIGNG